MTITIASGVIIRWWLAAAAPHVSDIVRSAN
jgi:hypothetical protein